jgi:hypothetical protein
LDDADLACCLQAGGSGGASWGALIDEDLRVFELEKYELQDKQQKHGNAADKEQINAKETRRKINSMTPEQKVKWIKDGD